VQKDLFVGSSPRFAPTKIHPPAVDERLQRRPRLDDLLDSSERIALVVAPAGYGKTIAVAQWAERCPDPVIWFTIDAQDRPAARFWTYVATAVARAVPHLGDETIRAIDEWAVDGIDMATVLLAELGQRSEPTVMVFDDVHHITDAAIIEQLEFFIERAPPSLKIIVITRTDPPYPVARWRVQGLLSEIRQADLELRPNEAAGLLSGVPFLTLDASTRDRLIDHTGGWPAALHLAALSVSGREDADRYVREDLESDRMLFDFVVGEVLERLPTEDRGAVLALSMLDDIDATRCELLTDCTSGDALLRRLVRIGLPIVSLDAGRRTFRFHALFRELVQLELKLRDAPRVVDLHRRAARAERASGDASAVVRHLLAAGDHQEAFDVVFGPVWELYRAGATRELAAWLDQFPFDVLPRDPARIVTFATALGLVGRLDEASRWNELAAPLITVDDEIRDGLVLSRVLVDLGRGDTAAIHLVVDHLSPEAFHRTTREDPQARMPTVLAIAHLVDGAVAPAARWVDAIAAGPTPPERLRAVGYPARRAWLAFERGDLEDAQQLADRTLAAAGPEARGAANAMIELHMVKALVAAERGDVDQADLSADRAMELATTLGAPLYILLAHGARLAAVEARSGSQATLSAAVQLVRTDAPRPVRDRYGLLIADLAARAGQWVEAERHLEDLPPSPTRLLIDARVAIGLHRSAQAAGLLDEMDTAGWPRRRLIQFEVLRHTGQVGDTSHLQRALELGVTRGFVTSYARERCIHGATLRQLVEADPRWRGFPLATALRSQPTSSEPDRFVLVEALSKRELEVLQMLPTHLTTVEIAQLMFVSAHTVRTHIRVIYRKLAVSSRSEAVRRAAALGLTPGTEAWPLA
jgi:LuxR family maltose regulon positive regulatory protein